MEKINWASVQKEVPEWFRDAKFGMFFHWGPYSVPAYKDEWYSRRMYEKGSEYHQHHVKTYGSLHDFGYKDFYPMMKGERFDPDEWAELIKKTGAVYAGPVSERADNFAMWDSKVNPVNSVHYGPHRDVVGECFRSFRKKGIKTLATFHHQWLWGWFMSTDVEADVYIPGNEVYYGPVVPLEANRATPYIRPDRRFCEIWRDKVVEVIDRYDPDVVYFDSRTNLIEEDIRFEIPEYYYHKKGKEQGIITYKFEDFPEGIGVFDLECRRFAAPSPFVWQVDEHLEASNTWGIIQEPEYRSSAFVIRELCDIVSKNGNLLLSVGPCADGSFHPDAVRVLEEIGEWLAQNGEAIYGTRPYSIAAEGPTAGADAGENGFGQEIRSTVTDFSESDFRFTQKGDCLYVIAYGWPADGVFHIETLRRNGMHAKHAGSVEMIGCSEPLFFEQNETGLHVQAPKERPCKSAYVLKIRS